MIISPHLSWPTTCHAHMVTQSHADAPPVIDHTQALLGMSGNHGALQVDKAKWDVWEGVILRVLVTLQAYLSGHFIGYMAWLPTLSQIGRYLGAGRSPGFLIFQVLTAVRSSTCLLASPPHSRCFRVWPALGRWESNFEVRGTTYLEHAHTSSCSSTSVH